MKRSSVPQRPVVTADGDGVVGHSGTALLHETADRPGLTRALSRGLAAAFPNCRQHDSGCVVRDLAVMLADGGDCLSDLCVLRDHPDLFGAVASNATAWRVIDRLGETGLSVLRTARAMARQQAWERGMGYRTRCWRPPVLAAAVPVRAGMVVTKWMSAPRPLTGRRSRACPDAPAV